ncbi:hypothetical protein JQ557_10430 [Bradyrhizobium sp. U87765 SZCCT0131]|uniref:hypothetical protein n=1 Tax=unclassified Bradyrhizobium TaxID=2631580 RepID=UPI001BAD2706|nr:MULTISPECIES: hypothetical protein [unclassified Bradyrhizobium]MBR1218406.1 hypothetical protein [Bradyrhizobium sp. U87765 SZCCT0131]MBR1260648.1 hypothetical protein [Bradyrhizobium sp. U87765 SZCCT0134]MBR1303904.1 hypothetical protein [Bradyrhizobium sp. U87765 SZCCT0110]MBR1319510.1 hypothetical protein [Bradyrhizobium sp. U87765 SZCCT0109]MBR1347835.1 hypothetical protein [Bradyrhizobium sp. U87765 SZCCT0048]
MPGFRLGISSWDFVLDVGQGRLAMTFAGRLINLIAAYAALAFVGAIVVGLI